MTMTGEKMTSQTSGKSGSSQRQVNIEVNGLDVTDIASIQLADGWHNISNPRQVQFAVGESHSPLALQRVYPALAYQNEYGQDCWTTFSNILSFSDSPSSNTASGYSGSSSSSNTGGSGSTNR